MFRVTAVPRGIRCPLVSTRSRHSGRKNLARNPYEVLGIAKDSSRDQAKAAFLEKVRVYHPDVNNDPGATSMFQEITAAYDALSDESLTPSSSTSTQPSPSATRHRAEQLRREEKARQEDAQRETRALERARLARLRKLNEEESEKTRVRDAERAAALQAQQVSKFRAEKLAREVAEEKLAREVAEENERLVAENVAKATVPGVATPVKRGYIFTNINLQGEVIASRIGLVTHKVRLSIMRAHYRLIRRSHRTGTAKEINATKHFRQYVKNHQDAVVLERSAWERARASSPTLTFLVQVFFPTMYFFFALRHSWKNRRGRLAAANQSKGEEDSQQSDDALLQL